MSFRSTELSLPLRIVADSGDFIRLFAVVAVVIVACMAALIALIRKIKVAQALKLGED